MLYRSNLYGKHSPHGAINMYGAGKDIQKEVASLASRLGNTECLRGKSSQAIFKEVFP